jgi:hypothetical protein
MWVSYLQGQYPSPVSSNDQVDVKTLRAALKTYHFALHLPLIGWLEKCPLVTPLLFFFYAAPLR